MVVNAPTFDQVLPELLPLPDGRTAPTGWFRAALFQAAGGEGQSAAVSGPWP